MASRFQAIFTRFYRELLRIADNILLIMYYNSHLKMRQKMLETGIIKDIPAAPDYKRKDRLKLAKAICKNDRAMVRRLMPSLEKILDKSLTEMFPKAEKIKKIRRIKNDRTNRTL